MATDLRTFLEELDRRGDLKRVNGAGLEYEIGCIAETAFHRRGPALLFDEIPGYASGFRVASNLGSTRQRALMAIGTDPDTPEADAMRAWKARWKSYEGVPPRVVANSPLLENALFGEDVDLNRIPVPVWHELDGGPYIGSGVAVILKDPDTGSVNLGSYRLQVHDGKTTGLFCEPANDGSAILRKYWDKGQACPVAVSVGPEPVVFLTASGSTGCPPGVPEYEYVGFLCNEAVDVIEGRMTGLPISAGSEIAFEGEIPPPDVESRREGPFGEWTGYYMITSVPEPVIRVTALYYRNDPILFGAPPFKPHRESYAFSLPMRSMTGLWSRLEKDGLPVTRVTDLVKMGAVVVSVDQKTSDDVAADHPGAAGEPLPLPDKYPGGRRRKSRGSHRGLLGSGHAAGRRRRRSQEHGSERLAAGPVADGRGARDPGADPVPAPDPQRLPPVRADEGVLAGEPVQQGTAGSHMGEMVPGRLAEGRPVAGSLRASFDSAALRSGRTEGCRSYHRSS